MMREKILKLAIIIMFAVPIYVSGQVNEYYQRDFIRTLNTSYSLANELLIEDKGEVKTTIKTIGKKISKELLGIFETDKDSFTKILSSEDFTRLEKTIQQLVLIFDKEEISPKEKASAKLWLSISKFYIYDFSKKIIQDKK